MFWPSEVRPVQDADIEGLKAIARGAHTDSRFFFDSRFGKEHAADLFADWIATDCAGRADNVLVVDSSDSKGRGLHQLQFWSRCRCESN